MQTDIDYLKIAIDKYGSQKKLAHKLTELSQSLHSDTYQCSVSQQRIGAWLNRDNKLPTEIIIPLQLALKAVGVKVSKTNINPSIYPKSSRLKDIN